MKYYRSKCLRVCFLIGLLVLGGCKKFVQVAAPVTSINGSNVYANDATAASVLTGIYAKMSNSFAGLPPSMSFIGGLSSDEFTLYSASTNPSWIGYYSNALSNTNTSSVDFWTSIYPVVFIANSAIEGLQSTTSLTPAVKTQLMGEALFVRAFCYFYLVNLYGDVPLVTGTNYRVNATVPRSSKISVWNQIKGDLQQAEVLLNSKFVYSDGITVTAERTRPNKWTAMALAARTYLYAGDWAAAEAAADSLIDNIAPFPLALVPKLDSVFKKNSSEAIWQLQPVTSSNPTNTIDGYTFIIPTTGPSPNLNPVFLSNNLLNNFEPNDLRRKGGSWVNSVVIGGVTYYYPYKYKVNTNVSVSEYEMVFRLGEQFLIRAEARAQQGDINGALYDINAIRNRAGLPNYAGATDQGSVLTAILHERQVELFTEWGHRWLDLKRTGAVDAVMTLVCPQKGGVWNSNDQWYPIPLSELQYDYNLKQNDGY